ncbi:pirin family protein [Sphingosinicella sp. BN140058]|uniref:pirin family protein n=1 Tax=Sphingosinicella sp. BN140058 TaxID=1892855 RepID=UPI00197DB07D|nr:pirin family protein [Sphingosinicella sp. BN140058]
MIQFRDRGARGHHRGALVDARHSFSFGHYHDPKHMGFRSLRVINEDRVVPGAGFPDHGHENMEIVTIVLQGRIRHRDSLGNEATIGAGDVQRMSAGTGVVHSETNPSEHERAHALQIWILPSEQGLPPSYEQKHFPPEQGRNQFVAIATRDGREGSVRLHQDAAIEIARLDEGNILTRTLSPDRGYWVQVIGGVIGLNGTEMREGDGAAMTGEALLSIEADTDAELLLFDLQ